MDYGGDEQSLTYLYPCNTMSYMDEDNLVLMCVRVSQEMREKVAYLGRLEQRSLSDMVRQVLRRYINKHSQKLKKLEEEHAS